MRKKRKQSEPDISILIYLLSGVCFIIVFCLHIQAFFPGLELITDSYFNAVIIITGIGFVPGLLFLISENPDPRPPMTVKQMYTNIINLPKNFGKQPFYDQLATIIIFYIILNFIFCAYGLGDEIFHNPKSHQIFDMYYLQGVGKSKVGSIDVTREHYYKNMSYLFRIVSSWGFLLSYSIIHGIKDYQSKLKK